ncbi:hypothetical protein AB0451_40210 [Streptomyces sp. NPDC052000]|uniref:hypothetical protein n=1 Tax=Streptomyces sp. NPDC052000 TaxID=3155676 RepID=UPI00344E1919
MAARSIHVPPEPAEETNAAGGIAAVLSSLPLQREEGIEGQTLEVNRSGFGRDSIV